MHPAPSKPSWSRTGLAPCAQSATYRPTCPHAPRLGRTPRLPRSSIHAPCRAPMSPLVPTCRTLPCACRTRRLRIKQAAQPGRAALPASPALPFPATELAACLTSPSDQAGYPLCLGPRPIKHCPSCLSHAWPNCSDFVWSKLFDHHPTKSWARSLQLPRLRKLCTRTALTIHHPATAKCVAVTNR